MKQFNIFGDEVEVVEGKCKQGMKIDIITDTLLQTVVDTIYDTWHHEGRIEIEHSDDFYFTLDNKLYCVQVREVDEIEDQGVKQNDRA